MNTDSPAFAIADLIHQGFDTFYEEFKRLTREARRWFDEREWIRIHEDSHRRIDLYQRHVRMTLEALEPLTKPMGIDLDVWKAAHREFAVLTAERVDCEVAETFFNAITRKIFRTVGVNHEIEFLENHFGEVSTQIHGLYRRVPWESDLAAVFERVLAVPSPALEFVDRPAEAEYLAKRFRSALEERVGSSRFDHLDILCVLFFRVREAYIVGRVAIGGRHVPLLIPIQATADGVVVDGAIFSLEETLQVFSSTRSYMFVDVHKPSDLARFLGTLMPDLALSELYIAFAHHRHGKTLIYRELVDHLDKTTEKFIVAPGIKGLVMTVFTMPGYQNVFKIIRDTFEKPGATREAIMTSYRDVFRGRRVGRLADTQEFEHLAFDKARFTDECLAELLSKASDTVEVVGDKVVVKHLYIEQKMDPFNIFLERTPAVDAKAAIVDYGEAIKELAANDIFAGDLLWKNFGVTRFGTLVLYDYDEIRPLTACTFRAIPVSDDYDDELSANRYYATSADEVFPEEWAPFIVPRDPVLADAFKSAHADLLGPDFWNRMKDYVAEGQLEIGLPYHPRYPELQSEPVSQRREER